MKFSLYLLFFALAGTYVVAQKSGGQNPHLMEPYGQVTLFAGGGVAYYMGDISASSGNLGLGPAFALGGSYRLTERISARGEFRLYKVSGDSKNTNNPEKNLSFKTVNPDLMVSLQADLFPYSRRALVSPYGLLGLGVTYLNPKAEWEGTVYSLPKYRTEGVKYSRLPLFITGGLGASVRISRSWSAGLELTGNFLLSDYLDDVSTVYPEFDQLIDPDISYALSYRGSSQQPGYIRGNPKSKDSYMMLTAKVIYSLPNPRYAKERKIMKCAK
ncbi:hypothetical protein GCM10023091_01480 [Ravibacter arvi]|uniref:Outer membrane protein beta-barrel domain-containing protein n=1 Tax=Ravibacter arvi TaxID=2051041 RepID=A0ABP8LLA4_9BACT